MIKDMDDIAKLVSASSKKSPIDDVEKLRNTLMELEGFSPSPDMVASLFQDYEFDHKIVSSLTPITKGEAIDVPIYRPQGMKGWIINLTIKGSGRIYLKDGHYKDVKKGDICLFPPHAPHHYQRVEDDEKWYHRWIYFHPYRQWGHLLKWRYFRDNIYFLSLKEQDCISVENIFEQILQENYNAKFLSFEVTINLLEHLLLKCQQIDQNALQWRQMNPKILKACLWITEHLRENFTLQDVAQHVALSPSQLSHLFKQQVGSSVITWKHSQLINQASMEIRQKNTPINQIAYQFGFNDPLYFSRLFKKIHGISPKKYRELWKTARPSLEE